MPLNPAPDPPSSSPRTPNPSRWQVRPGSRQGNETRDGGSHRGRGCSENPAGRFEVRRYVASPEAAEAAPADEGAGPRTLYMSDPSRSILSENQSPDIPFDRSLNPYRGCEHGCSYCYARPTHEYLGFSAGLDFETRILAKEQAPALLRRVLESPRWQPQVIAMSGVTDPYQPIERRLGITRGCLEVLAEFRNPVGIITKSAGVTRDADLLAELAGDAAAVVNLSITTLDADLQRAMEPRASHPGERLRAIEALASRGIPVGVMVAPVIPGLTEPEIPRILKAAADAGAQHAGHIVLRLPYGVKDLFAEWLERHYPHRKAKVLHRVQALRGGRLNDSRFGQRMRGEGLFAEQITQLFELSRRRARLRDSGPTLSTAAFRRPEDPQLGLFAQHP